MNSLVKSSRAQLDLRMDSTELDKYKQYIGIIDTLHNYVSSIIDESGGVAPQSDQLLNGCTSGEQYLTEFPSLVIYLRAALDGDESRVGRNFNYLIQAQIIDSETLFSESYVKDATVDRICRDLLMVELYLVNTILFELLPEAIDTPIEENSQLPST